MAELTKEAACREIAERHAIAWDRNSTGNYRLAETIQLALREAYDAGAKAQREEGPRLEAGTSVHVDCPQFTGDGIVVGDPGEHNRWVSVRLENGNVWQYPYEAIRQGRQ